MSSQEVIYSSLRFLQSPSESPDKLRPGGTQRPGKTDDKEFSVSWHLIVLTLGILCLILLMTVTVLGTKIFQDSQEKHQQEENLRNLSQKYQSIQNDSYLKEQLLTNKTLEYDILRNETLQQKKELDSLLLEKKRCHRKQIFLKSLQNTGKLYEDRWSCLGVKCYYFTNESKGWNGCLQTCQNYSLSLLKIEDEDELAFIQPQTYRKSYWIGLSYNEKERKWKWIDNGTSSGINFTIMSLPSGRGKCAFLTSTRITDIDCSHIYNCICEKKIDRVFTARFNRHRRKEMPEKDIYTEVKSHAKRKTIQFRTSDRKHDYGECSMLDRVSCIRWLHQWKE